MTASCQFTLVALMVFAPFLVHSQLRAQEIQQTAIGDTSDLRSIRSFHFIGNKTYSDKMLLKNCGMEFGQSISPREIVTARVKLLELYKSAGFAHASINIEFEFDRSDRMVFRIKEGRRQTTAIQTSGVPIRGSHLVLCSIALKLLGL